MNATFPRFSQHSAILLLAAGFVPEFYPAQWEDVGDPENGPKLDGYPDTVTYTLPNVSKGADYEVVVVDNEVVAVDYLPAGPEGWDEQF